MEFFLVCAAAFAASALTFFSGFGLGTLLMPVFALFFPVEVAVSATAAVHLANNVFKFLLVGRQADRRVTLRFVLPAIVCAAAGAAVLSRVAHVPPLWVYTFFGKSCSVTAVKVVVAVLLAVFAWTELNPRMKDLSFDPKFISLGGAISGFFGGLSGHQGALRGAFLIRAGLSKEVFIGTSVVCAVAVDLSRLAVYGFSFSGGSGMPLIVGGSLAAFAGSFLGSRFLQKVTLRGVQAITGWMLVFIALLLGSGLI